MKTALLIGGVVVGLLVFAGLVTYPVKPDATMRGFEKHFTAHLAFR